MRRFTRLTNAFSKKVENHAHAVALHFMWYNFCPQGATDHACDGRRSVRSRVVAGRGGWPGKVRRTYISFDCQDRASLYLMGADCCCMPGVGNVIPVHLDTEKPIRKIKTTAMMGIGGKS